MSEEIDFNRFEFSISLGQFDAHVARWRMHTCCVLLTEHVARKFAFFFFFLTSVNRALRHLFVCLFIVFQGNNCC